MNNITQTQVKQAIDSFLTALFDKKALALLKSSENAIEDNNLEAQTQAQEGIEKIQEKYALDAWMEYANSWMSEQLSFGTHISKGIHASSKGDNVIYMASASIHERPIVGHHSIANPLTDASGNAAALPLAAFVQVQVYDEQDNYPTISELIEAQHPALSGVFHSNPDISKQIQDTFYKLVVAHIDTPTTDELNKQLLWPIAEEDQSQDSAYHCIIPLYPTALTHHLYEKIQDIKFSDANTLAKKNKDKLNEVQTPYNIIKDLAVVNIGGSNPQGVSQLMSKKRGKTYLLPSLPPSFIQTQAFSFSKNSSSIFNAKTMAYKTRNTLDALYKIIGTRHNNMSIRDARKAILDDLLLQILKIANGVQSNRSAGWSKDYHNLDYAEKLWLDPFRGELESEADFKTDFEKGHWQQEIEAKFAAWLQTLLQKEFPKLEKDFGDSEHNQWEREMADALTESKRLGQGAFA